MHFYVQTQYIISNAPLFPSMVFHISIIRHSAEAAAYAHVLLRADPEEMSVKTMYHLSYKRVRGMARQFIFPQKVPKIAAAKSVSVMRREMHEQSCRRFAKKYVERADSKKSRNFG